MQYNFIINFYIRIISWNGIFTNIIMKIFVMSNIHKINYFNELAKAIFPCNTDKIQLLKIDI